jgi:hypothetical protein
MLSGQTAVVFERGFGRCSVGLERRCQLDARSRLTPSASFRAARENSQVIRGADLLFAHGCKVDAHSQHVRLGAPARAVDELRSRAATSSISGMR